MERVNEYIQNVELKALKETTDMKREADVASSRLAQIKYKYSDAIKLQDELEEAGGEEFAKERITVMSLIMRILLIVVSVCTFLYMIRKLRKAQMQTLDTLFWTLFSLTILLMSIFSDFVIKCAEYLGVQSAVNFVYLVMIFFLILRLFLLNVRICKLELKLNEYVEKMAVIKNLEENSTNILKE